MSPSIRHLDIPAPDGMADAVLARPEAEGPYPGVLLFMDAFGLRPVLEGMAGRLASHGYAVLAPNLFYREGRVPLISDLPSLMLPENRPKLFEQLRPMMRNLTPERLVGDAGAYLDFLAGESSGPIGVVGYCMGGRAALLTASAYPERIAAVASFHGGNLATEAEDSPHRGVARIRGEAYVGHADQDQSMPPEQMERLEEALRSAAVTYRTELYSGAAHGWTMADTAAYHPEAAERHWERLLDLFRRNLLA